MPDPDFHAPYNFIPVTGQIDGSPTPKQAFDAIQQGRTAIRHDLWLPGQYSGRVLCRLHLDTPTVVGAAQKEDAGQASKRVEPYCRNGQPAIPGNSLRGMVSTIAEALSQSALRVLEDKNYSVRVPVGQGLSAVGLLRPATDKEDAFQLLPLTLPILDNQKDQGNYYDLPDKWRQAFKNMPLNHCLAAYIDGYQSIKVNSKKQPPIYSSGTFLDCTRPRAFEDISGSDQYWYARLHKIGFVTNKRIPLKKNKDGLREIPIGSNSFLLGQKLLDSNLLTHEQFDCLSSKEKIGYTKGILRILGIDERADQIPTTKKHELFLPMAPVPPSLLRVPKAIAEQFERLAAERAKATEKEPNPHRKLPFTLAGYEDWQLKAGRLVFFDVELHDNRPVVSRLSLSSIWRREIEDSAQDFFKVIDPDLVPWNPNRQGLTPAECLFGVVEEEKAATEKSSRNLASRLRFSDALPLEGHSPQLWEREVPLRILASPKPPSPAMYFHPANAPQGGYIEKTALNKEAHRPNGRKVYLHHGQAAQKKDHWETRYADENANQKLRCTPLEADQDFYFHIDFEGLSTAELTLLLCSLRPDIAFRHRLGLGKPLGLGSVRVDILGTCLIDRSRRYGRTALNEPRYHGLYQETALTGEAPPTGWKSRYQTEDQALQHPPTAMTFTPDPSLIDTTTLQRPLTLGDPDRLSHEVHYPTQPGQNREQEGFRWFMKNDEVGVQDQAQARLQARSRYPVQTRPKAQALGEVPTTGKLPTLREL